MTQLIIRKNTKIHQLSVDLKINEATISRAFINVN